MQTLWPRIRGLVFFGWCVALVRLVLEATVHPGEWSPGWFVGVDILMPVAFIVYGFRGTLDDVRWPKYILIAILLGVLVWGIPNFIAYTTAQFMGWQHGRFEPIVYKPNGWPEKGHGPPLADTTPGKIMAGLKVAGGTAIFGTVGVLVLSTLLIWLPGVVRRKRKSQPAV